MTDRLDDHGRRAAAAVRTRTARVDTDRGLDAVVRRARRPRAVTVAAVLLAGLLAVPAIGWLLASGTPLLEFADEPPAAPAPAPTGDPTGDREEAEDTAGAATAAPEDVPEDDRAPGGQDAPDPGTAGTASPEQPTDPPAPPGATPLGEFGTSAVLSASFRDSIDPDFLPGDLRIGAPLEGASDTPTLLTDVRVGRHEGFDRVVLEFEGGTSPYEVTYVEPPILSDGEGAEVDVAGEAFLRILFLSASGMEWDPEAEAGFRAVYDGPDRLSGATELVTEVVRTGDFEATLSWVVGLDARAPFAVSVLQDPLRLVVDVEAP